MLKTSPKHWRLTYSHLMQLYIKLVYIWVPVLALVDYQCLSFVLIVYWGQNSEGRHFLQGQLVDIFFCSFYYDALYFFLANFDLSHVFFLLFFLKVFMCWLLFFVCKYQGFVSAVSIMRDFVPAIYDTTVVIPKDSPAPTMLRILKGQSSVVSTSTFNSVDPNCWDAINF